MVTQLRPSSGLEVLVRNDQTLKQYLLSQFHISSTRGRQEHHQFLLQTFTIMKGQNLKLMLRKTTISKDDGRATIVNQRRYVHGWLLSTAVE